MFKVNNKNIRARSMFKDNNKDTRTTPLTLNIFHTGWEGSASTIVSLPYRNVPTEGPYHIETSIMKDFSELFRTSLEHIYALQSAPFIDHFCQNLHFRYLAGFRIRLCEPSVFITKHKFKSIFCSSNKGIINLNFKVLIIAFVRALT